MTGMSSDSLNKIVPFNNVLWHVLDSVAEIKVVSVAKQRSGGAFFKPDFVHRISKRKFFSVRWKLVQSRAISAMKSVTQIQEEI